MKPTGKLKIVLTLLTLGVLVTITYVFINKANPASINAFALEQNSSVDKILVYKNNLPSGGFIKAFNGEWMLNNGTKVDQDMAAQMLSLLKEVKVKDQVASEKQKEIKATLKKQGFVVEYYQEEFLSKAFFIGAIPGEGSYSYAMLDGDDIPYQIYIPKTKHNLVTLFSIPEIDWKDRTLFDSKPENIVALKIENFQNPKDSFWLKNDSKNFKLLGSNRLNKKALREYLKEFENFKAGTLISHNEMLLDSLKLSKPFCRITVNETDPSKNISVTFYSSKGNKEIFYARPENCDDVFIISYEKVNSLTIKRKQLSS